MQRILIALACFLMVDATMAQQQSVEQLRATALSFQRNQDFSNAVMVLDRALQIEPGNLKLLKDLAYTHYLSGDLDKAANQSAVLMEREDVDEQAFQIAARILRSREEYSKCEKILKKGLKRFEGSGPLCTEIGEVYWELKRPALAIKYWEDGLESEPSYSGNYYHAAKFYYAAGDKARSIIYGEIFLNLESYSPRSNEIKILLLESYKRVFMPGDIKQHYIKEATDFEKDFLAIMERQNSLALRGINPETLFIIRSRFILDWFASNGSKYRFYLFEHMRNLMRSGLFEAYNQWIFGSASNPDAFMLWTGTHASAYEAFLNEQQSRVFTMPSGQHYF
ncbi:MAG: tetratricopeptide repeat protein [Bacteroidota bacterium]